MEELVRNTFGAWGYFIVPLISGVFISFIAEGLNRVTPAVVNNHLLLLIISSIATFIVLNVFPSYFQKDIWELVFAFILNLAFAYVFYFAVGKKTVDLIVTKAGNKVEDITNNGK